ncbi:MAG TPA: hypothetical protein VGA95_14795 [Thermodesulfobacteriota bacterium]
MTHYIKAGVEIIEEFFEEIGNIEGVQNDVATTLMNLYKERKLTNTNILNGLEKIREVKSSEDKKY